MSGASIKVDLTQDPPPLPGSRCGLALAHSIDDKSIRATNLYHAALDKQGTAAWAITWPVEFTHPRTR